MSFNKTIFFSQNTPQVPPSVFDKDGNEYNVIVINGQEWIDANLRTTTYDNGSAISNITDQTAWDADTTGAYSYYDNNAALYEDPYGVLYNWYAVDNASGLSYLESNGVQETGWRVATRTDFNDLNTFLDFLPGGRLKETGTAHWNSPNSEATDAYGFSMVGNGHRWTSPFGFELLKSTGDLWTATESTTTNAHLIQFTSNSGGWVIAATQDKHHGRGVRLVRDL